MHYNTVPSSLIAMWTVSEGGGLGSLQSEPLAISSLWWIHTWVENAPNELVNYQLFTFAAKGHSMNNAYGHSMGNTECEGILTLSIISLTHICENITFLQFLFSSIILRTSGIV